MKRTVYLLSVLALLTASSGYSNTDLLYGKSVFVPRATITNAARDAVGIRKCTHTAQADQWHAIVTVTPGYSNSVRSRRIAQALFGTETIDITGSSIAHRDDQDLLADYFGLSPSYQGSATFQPFVSTGWVTLYGYTDISGIASGLYASLLMPIVWTRWGLRMRENIFNNGSDTVFPARYMTVDAISAPARSFEQALNNGVTFGDMQSPLMFGKTGCEHHKHGVANVEFVLGYDIVRRDYGHVGLNARVTAPTGQPLTPTYLFNAVLGNNNHWELGIGCDGHVLLWEKDNIQEINLHLIANFTHLFGNDQCRSFDFKCDRFGSRYMLLKQFDETGNYARQLVPAINVTTLPVHVSIDIQMDFVALFSYTYRALSFDIGYNGWLRSREKLSLRGCIPDNTYGMKGIQNVVTDANQPSNMTESSATIFGHVFLSPADQIAVADPNPPVFIQTQDLDLHSGASSRLLTHKLFAHVGHRFIDRFNYAVPLIGLGGEIEFEGINPRYDDHPVRTTLALWSLWLKLGCCF